MVYHNLMMNKLYFKYSYISFKLRYDYKAKKYIYLKKRYTSFFWKQINDILTYIIKLKLKWLIYMSISQYILVGCLFVGCLLC